MANLNSSVLTVDDEENLLVLLDRVLSKEGYQVKLPLMHTKPWSFWMRMTFPSPLIDIRMYPIDGIALLVEIKKRSPSTHVLMMTSRPTTETQSCYIQNGAIDYFTKPLEIQKLKIALRGLVA